MSCTAPRQIVAYGGIPPSSLRIYLSGNDLTQTFTTGSGFAVYIEAASRTSDVLDWQIADYTGTSLASGSISVPQGSTLSTLVCSSSISGYFAVSARLQSSGATEPWAGSRPAGYVSFGVLPNVADFLPLPTGPLDQHRIGLQGSNYVESGRCCSGNGLQPVNENLGSTWVLDDRAQSSTEPLSPSQYDPVSYPLQIGLQEGRLARIVSLSGIPAWASTAASVTGAGSYPPKSFGAYQEYAALVGEESARIHSHYIPNQQKNYYQVTWEPDPGPSTQWVGTDAEFVALYQAVWKGVHSTDANAAVMGPTTQALVTCGQWLTRLAPLGLTPYLDAVACHGYYALGASSAIPPEPAGLAGQVRGLRQTITELMPAGTKLFVTETGISYPMGSQYAADYPTTEVLTQHAEVIVRTHLIMLGEGVDTSFLFYSADFQHDPGFGLYFNLAMGVAGANFNSPDISPKPAAMAVAAATRLVDGSRSLGALTNLPPEGYGYAFLLSDNTQIVTALWAHNGSFNARVSYPLWVDAAGKSGTVVVFDGMGNPKNMPYTNGLLQISLSEMPQYVLTTNRAVLQPNLRAPDGYRTSF